MKNDIPVVFTINNDYVPYCAVAIESIISSCDVNRTYSIFILYTKLTAENRERLVALSTINVTVHCRDVSREMEGISIITKLRYTNEVAYKLVIPKVLPHYEKVIYLDCDIVVLRDVARLYETDINEYILGVARIIPTIGLRDHLNAQGLGIPVQDYFNSGILLINTGRYTERNIMQKCFRMLHDEAKCIYLEETALNVTCCGDVKHFDGRWNFMWDCLVYHGKQPLPEYEEELKKVAADPWIIHFSGDVKPWLHPDKKFSDVFWNHARKSSFCEDIILSNLTGCFQKYRFPYESVPFGNTIVIYGTGEVGQAYCKQIKLAGIYKLAALVDSRHKQLLNFEYEVVAPEALLEQHFDMCVIAAAKRGTAEDIIGTLISMGVDRHKIIWADPIKNS